ncbi:hypothetical protein P879_10179 [Paragonimus westermani]|uniref:Uncharacterized protein n=1 Tax=Paragonimus westermani TaxID=34504 RepID=A0A8T0DA55_9TREM|nr:hypothetical protein P879_10179 [Paragonimus westermani]
MSFTLTNYHTQSSSAHPPTARIELNTLTAEDTSTSHNTLVGPTNWSLDVWAEVASIQIVSFLLNVCHVVLVVTDSLDTAPTREHRLIDRAALLKPTVYTASVLRHEEDRLATGLVNTTSVTNPSGKTSAVTAEPCHGAVKNGLRVNPDLGLDRNFKQISDEEVEVECASYANGQPTSGSPPVASADVAPSSVGPSVLFLRSEHEPKHSQPFDTEASDVVEAPNRLKCLTDYSASLIHVYNQAPSAALLDSAVCQKVNIYRHQLLPMAYPDYRPVEERGRNSSSLDRSAKVGASTIAADTAVQEADHASVDRLASDQDGVDDVNVLNEIRSSGTGSGADSNEDGRILKANEHLSHVLSEHGTRNVNSKFVDGDESCPNQLTGTGRSDNVDVVARDAVLHAVQTEHDHLLGDELLSQSGDPDPPESAVDEYELDDRSCDGEKLNARMTNLTHQVRSVRRDFINVQRRLSKSRFFLIPEVDGGGHSPVGCPIYSNSVRSLQEAILSTPRQHMIPQLTKKKWIAYTKQMWDAVCTSPILSDYHSILTN